MIRKRYERIPFVAFFLLRGCQRQEFSDYLGTERETIASTASEYPLAIFGFREPSLNPKNACWEHPKP